MNNTQTQNCSITYKTGMVIIRGEYDAIHTQANVIIRRYALSAFHYGITKDSHDKVILQVRH